MGGGAARDEAKREIEQVLSAYPQSCEFEYCATEANIKNGYLVKSRADRMRVCSLLNRFGITRRTPKNLAAEWLIHNVAYELHFQRASAVDVALDYVKDRRWQINAAARLLELLGIY